jgi:hypothetical protein
MQSFRTFLQKSSNIFATENQRVGRAVRIDDELKYENDLFSPSIKYCAIFVIPASTIKSILSVAGLFNVLNNRFNGLIIERSYEIVALDSYS